MQISVAGAGTISTNASVGEKAVAVFTPHDAICFSGALDFGGGGGERGGSGTFSLLGSF